MSTSILTLQGLRVRLLWAAMCASALGACSSGSGKEGVTNVPEPDQIDDDVITYTGPAPATSDVNNFKVHVWDKLAGATYCGGCHIEGGQNPQFVRRDDINLAYTAINPYVNLSDPTASALVSKVASGHNCWTPHLGFCEEKLAEWIGLWASDSGAESTKTDLQVPEVFEVGASLSFSDDVSGFAEHVHPLLSSYCADCHRADAPQAPVQPYFASTDVQVAYEAARTKMLFNVTETLDGHSIDASRSRLVVRLGEEAHNCWTANCADAALAMGAALEAFAATLELREADDTLVASKALRIGDGTAISQGGRIETNAVALYPFKAGSGLVANDYADNFPPALDLNLMGDVQWVSNWGLRFNGGRAQGTVESSAKLKRYIGQTGEYSVEAWVVPANVTQDGPARIVGYSGSNTERNFTLGQTLYNYDFFNRASVTDANGTPTVSTPDADEVLQATLQHVVASFNPVDGRKIYVNGELIVASDAAGGGLLHPWDDTFALVLGNETSGEYPWRGTIRFLAIHNRALTAEQVQTNFAVGVGQKILLAFSVAEHVTGMDDVYIVFQVEQFDDYSYLFHKPYFFSFTDAPTAPVDIQGLRIGINGREAPVGQAFANLAFTVTPENFQTEGTSLSELGAVIQMEKGAEQDQFFLSFDRIGASSRTRTEAEPSPPEESQDQPAVPDIGVRTFAEVNASLSAMTHIPITEASVAATYEAVKQQLPPVEDVQAFGTAHQMGITQLTVRYCSSLAEDAVRRAAFFPTFAGRFDSAGRQAVIGPLLAALVAHRISSDAAQLADQPPVAESEAVLNTLIDTMTSSCPDGLCSAAIVENTLTATCAAALGSAVMLIQ